MHKTHEKICLLNYKGHNFGGLHKENKTAHEEIKLWNRKPENKLSNKPRKSDKSEGVKESGCNLFKQILVKHSKVLNIKKN